MLPYNGGGGIPSYCAANLLLVVGEGGKNTCLQQIFLCTGDLYMVDTVPRKFNNLTGG
jgi:hypothetical protein